MPGRRVPAVLRAAVRRRLVMVTAVAGLLVAGCSALPDPVELAAGQLSSAAASSALVLEQRDDGHLTRVAASTALDDATREVAGASRSLVQLRLSGRRGALREALLASAVQLARTLHESADAVERGRSLAPAVTTLRGTGSRLSALEDEAARS